MIRICFECGEQHEGSDVVCEPCKAKEKPDVEMSMADKFLAKEKRNALRGSSGDSAVSILQMLISLFLF